ncbi:DNA polymerase IV [Patescibacteria group bacterium]|nr:DNA polymerase IV [Patescibacteria group bacterium]
MTAQIILHIDFDSFFASVEQQYRPETRGKPMGVTAANSRSCIIASSREAKKLGIKTGSRSYEVQKICPNLILVSADFNKYFEVSKKFLNICKDYSPFTELFSIDEVFMDVTKTAHLFGGVEKTIEIIKRRIKTEIGEYITASFGVSHNKLLAKLGSGLNKPNGLTEIKPEDVIKIYTTTELTDVCGIGERIKRRLNAIGIDNLIQLRNAPFDLLLREFGNAEGNFLKRVGLGIDNSRVIPYTEPTEVKSVGRSYCLPKNEYNKEIVLKNLYELCEEIGIKLRRLGKKGQTINIGLNGEEYIRGRKTFKAYFDLGSEIYNLAFSLIKEQFKSKSYVRQIHISVSKLEDKNNLTLSLFDFENKKGKITETVDNINNRFGSYTIRNGFLLYADKLTTVPNGYLADRHERNKLAQSTF